ncbi:hypothetical protein Celaphus_00000522, partial [Cervus elaphus hippelaphus]
FKRQVTSGSLEVISIPAYFYPNISHAAGSTDDSEKLESWRIKQVLDFCFLMLYAQPKAMYYLQEKCIERNKHIRIRYKPSLFQHVGIQSSYPGREQYF